MTEIGHILFKNLRVGTKWGDAQLQSHHLGGGGRKNMSLGQPELHSKTLSEKEKKEKKPKTLHMCLNTFSSL
jgi:hypothetical protein